MICPPPARLETDKCGAAHSDLRSLIMVNRPKLHYCVKNMKRLLLCALILTPLHAHAQDDHKIAAGKVLVEKNCAGCHATGASGASPHPEAPAFRVLHLRYPIESLAEALAEGISTGHLDMPEFVATPKQIDAVIAYIGSLGLK